MSKFADALGGLSEDGVEGLLLSADALLRVENKTDGLGKFNGYVLNERKQINSLNQIIRANADHSIQ